MLKLLFLPLIFLLWTNQSSAAGKVETGLHIPLDGGEVIGRLQNSPYKSGWLKVQYSLGSNQPLDARISQIKNAGYKMMVSVAKNLAGIPELGKPSIWSKQYCPYDNELQRRIVVDTDPTTGNQTTYEEIEPSPIGNGYMETRDRFQALAPRLSRVDAVEIWNEPNLIVEWTDQGLGPISPKNYARFAECAIKGLRTGGYKGPVVSAGLAPLAGSGENMDDLEFFNGYKNAGGLDIVDGIGVHANITENLSPNNISDRGFKRVDEVAKIVGNKPIWITEYGWARDDAKIARSTQNQYIAEAVSVAKSLKANIEAMMVWNYGFTLQMKPADRTRSDLIKEFIQWDIEQSNVDLECSTEGASTNIISGLNSQNIVAPTTQDDQVIASALNTGIIPKQITENAYKTYIKPAQPVVTDVQQGFFSSIQSLFNSSIQSLFNSIICVRKDEGFCQPYLAIGQNSINNTASDSGRKAGVDSVKLVLDSNIYTNSYLPQSMGVNTAPKDCNFVQRTPQGIGDQLLRFLSGYRGTNTGVYGVSIPNFESIQEEIDVRRNTPNIPLNISIGNKNFYFDHRIPDIDTRQNLYYQSYFPNGIQPLKSGPDLP